MLNQACALIRLMSMAGMVLLAGGIDVFAAPQDRPATPTDVAVYHCSRQQEFPPKICVSFKNAATEPVGFWFEWTRNGDKLPSTLAGYDAQCLQGSLYGCDALNWFGGPTAYAPKVRYTTDREWAFGFVLVNLDYDTDFCFRFKAVNKDGIVSENWSEWRCANTGGVPVIPSPPKAPVVTLMQATSGLRTPGEGTPWRLLVEWEKDLSDKVGWYEIEREGNLGTGSIAETIRQEADKPTEVMIPLVSDRNYPITNERKFRVRVCAANPAMRKCSGWGANLVFTSTVAEARESTSRSTVPTPGSTRFEPGAPSTADAPLGTRRPAAATANLVGSEVSFQTSNFLDRYIRHRGFLGYTEPIVGDLGRGDATFRIVPGLNSRCVSLESQNHPDHFLRHERFRIKLARRENTPLFRDDATFCLVSGLAAATGVSLESATLPGHFIRHRNSELWLDRSNGSDQFRKDATFNVTHPGGQMIVR